MIIGTRFSIEDGKFIRKMHGENCKGEEKVKRLKEVLKEKNIEILKKCSFKLSYAEIISKICGTLPLEMNSFHKFLNNF